ncbi:hypothetical protein AGMMS49983_06600 [Clostridia bacterium]|nr:hypothetical protein AGMMS49983_06600 [Clostridia bacterium]
MKKAKLIPLYFNAANEREQGEFKTQIEVLKEMYGDVAEILPYAAVGDSLPEADAIVFPQLIGAAFRDSDALVGYGLPIIALTSRFGTVEMWDWEIVTYLREKGLNVYSPYNIELAKVIIRSFAAKSTLKIGAKFLMFQDSPGEGMQAYIFKRFFWWEEEATRRLEEDFGIKLVYRSYLELNERVRTVSDEDARAVAADWHVPVDGALSEKAFLLAVKLYIATKTVIDEEGGVQGVGANCLNESFHSETTPCLAWNELFERDGIIFACEGDTLTMISAFILYRCLEKPVMMTNLYPFLMGMAALAHEKIDHFPDIEDPDNHALGVHCGYFGFAPQSFCSKWTMRPKALEIVGKNAHVIDCEFAKGPVTLAKIYPDLKRFSIIKAEIEDYVTYPGSDCLNGALIRYGDGHKIMEHLCSHHSLIVQGDQVPALLQVAKTFGFDPVVL